MKRLFALFFAIVTTICFFAQDIIVTKDAKKVEAKIEEVTPTEIKYKKANYLNGPTFVMPTKEIRSITYANGEEYIYESDDAKSQAPLADDSSNTHSVKRWFGLSIGWIFRDNICSYTNKLQNSAGKIVEYSTYTAQTMGNTLQVGFTFSPTFGNKGFGLYSGLYYEHTWGMKYVTMNKVKDAQKNTLFENKQEILESQYYKNGLPSKLFEGIDDELFIPIHFQYMHAFDKDMRLYVSVGPGFEYSISKSRNLDIVSNTNIVLGCRFGFQVYGAQLSLVSDWGVFPHVIKQNYGDRNIFYHRPISVQISYMF